MFLRSKEYKIDKSNKSMASKNILAVNPLQPPIVDVEHIPLADVHFKITYIVIEFNLLELHCWSQEKSLDQANEVFIWGSNL